MGGTSGLVRDIDKLIKRAGTEDDFALWHLRGADAPLETVIESAIQNWVDEDGHWGENGWRPKYTAPTERVRALGVLMRAVVQRAMERIVPATLTRFQSQIEELLFFGIAFACEESDMPCLVGSGRGDQSVTAAPDSEWMCIEVVAQPEIAGLHADFLVKGKFPPVPVLKVSEPLTYAVAVECDGHDFHERTKEQARRDKQRDRRMMSAGVPVVRFAGSEIWESPLERGRWLVEHVRHMAHRPAFERLFQEEGQGEIDRLARLRVAPDQRGCIAFDTGMTLADWAKRLGLKPPPPM